MSIKPAFYYFLTFWIITSALLNEHLIVDFFRAKFSSAGIIFTCATKKEQMKLAKALIKVGLQVSFANIAGKATESSRMLTNGQRQLVMVMDAECDNIDGFLIMWAELRFFYGWYHWLAFGSSPEVIEKFKHVPLTINTDLNIAIPVISNHNYHHKTRWEIFDVYNPSYNHFGKLHVQSLGYYNEKLGYQVKIKEAKYHKRRNMTGVLFRTAMVIPENISIPLEEYMASDKDRHNNTFTRFQSVTIRNCQDFFNFTMNVSLLHSWGYEQKNGDVDGMVKELEVKNIDFGLAPLMFKLYRLKRMDFGYGNFMIKSVFIFRHPKTTSTSYELFCRPLKFAVWISTLATLITIVVILRLTIANEIHPSNRHDCETSWSFLILYGVGEICQQGFSYVPTLTSGRIAVFIVVVFSFLIYQFYSASLVSSLLQHPPRTINTLSDLLKSPLTAACENSLFDMDYFAKTTDPVSIELYKQKMVGSNDHFLPSVHGLKHVQQGSYAYHTQTYTAYAMIAKSFPEEAICDLAEVQMYPSQLLYMSIQKRSPFKKMFNYCMAHQQEVGVVDRLKKYWNAPKPFCTNPTNYLEITVSLVESYWALIMLGLGILLSLFLLALEYFWTKKGNLIMNVFRRQNVKILRQSVHK